MVFLKDEFYLDQCFSTKELARRATKNTIQIYNTNDFTYLWVIKHLNRCLNIKNNWMYSL